MLAPAPPVPDAHLAIITPAGAAIIFLVALVIDTWGLGGPRLAPFFDRVAWIGWVCVWTAGFDGTGLTKLVAGTLNAPFAAAAGMLPWPLLAGLVEVMPQVIGGLAFALTIGCLSPKRVRVLGALAQLEFSDLKAFTKGVMAHTGVTRVPATAGAPGAGAPVRGGAPPWRKLFPGQVNVGLMAVALILVTFGAVLDGGFGDLLRWMQQQCVEIGDWGVTPALRWMKLA